MKNLKTIALPKIVLYSPYILNKTEIENELKNSSGMEYAPDWCEYKNSRRRWIFCDFLTYTIDESGNFITIDYNVGDGNLTYTIVTNDIFYIDKT